ncbi:MAG: hypothetical protein K1000chlam2_00870 [Chlamydiae bacterium]|nr:hypothetical protein [Chlamydiota bacterium]
MTSDQDEIISDFLSSIGPWNKHIIIGGGYAPIIYRLYLTDQKSGNPPVGTQDIDSLIPRKIPETPQKNISKYLLEAGFKHVFRNHDHPPVEAYVKEINNLEIEIEFLTHSDVRKNKNKNVLIGGVVAQPLSYLTLSLEKTIQFQTHSGKAGMVVSPAAWMFHKGLTFPKRKSKSKMHKDLYGIWYVATQLENFSEKSIIEFNFLSLNYPKWFKTFQKNMRDWTENAAPIEWHRLETQDPFGKLTRLNFERIIKRLVDEAQNLSIL